MVFLESELINKVKSIVEDKYKIFEEVGLLTRSIDMVLLDDDKSLITIEFKIRDWRKAIVQINDHLIAADYAYLCMPKKRISEEMSNLLVKNGIGLWLYDYKENKLIEEIEPSKSVIQWTFYRDSLINRLSQMDGRT